MTISGATHPLGSASPALDDAATPAVAERARTSSWRRLRVWGPVAVVCLPIMWAAVRAAVGGWVPIGDDAYFTVRSRDVLTSHHPLLGAWSSGSLDLETPINNLGPVQLDLLAAFTRFTPMGGTAIGVALINPTPIAVPPIGANFVNAASRSSCVGPRLLIGVSRSSEPDDHAPSSG